MTSQKDVKKSKFPALTSALTTDYFDFVRSNQNYRITLANLITAMGVSGPLQSLGDVAATPVLKVDGGINYIRNLLGGSGITTGLSSQDGVEVKHNFSPDKTGTPVLINETAVQPTIRSIQAGSGITVGGAGGVIQISTSGIPSTTKTIQVFQESDFPTAVGGVITLAADTQYLVLNDISTANRFAMSEGTVITGGDNLVITLTYTGSGNMITATDVSCKIDKIALSAASGTVFAVSSTTGQHRFHAFFVDITALYFGTFTHMEIVHLEYIAAFITTTGIVFSGDFELLLFRTAIIVMLSGTGNAIDLGSATFDFLEMDSVFGKVNTTGYMLDGLVSSGNINSGGSGTVARCRQFGSATFLNNISPYDDLWQFEQNSGIPNSEDLCLVTHAGVTITIGAAATPVIVGATWVTAANYRFSTVVGGRWTYTGKGTIAKITASISADIASGVDDISFFLYKNGTQITNSQVTREFDSGNIGNLSMIWAEELTTNDYLELWVQNDDAAVNVIIDGIKLRIE